MAGTDNKKRKLSEVTPSANTDQEEQINTTSTDQHHKPKRKKVLDKVLFDSDQEEEKKDQQEHISPPQTYEQFADAPTFLTLVKLVDQLVSSKPELKDALTKAAEGKPSPLIPQELLNGETIEADEFPNFFLWYSYFKDHSLTYFVEKDDGYYTETFNLQALINFHLVLDQAENLRKYLGPCLLVKTPKKLPSKIRPLYQKIDKFYRCLFQKTQTIKLSGQSEDGHSYRYVRTDKDTWLYQIASIIMLGCVKLVVGPKTVTYACKLCLTALSPNSQQVLQPEKILSHILSHIIIRGQKFNRVPVFKYDNKDMNDLLEIFQIPAEQLIQLKKKQVNTMKQCFEQSSYPNTEALDNYDGKEVPQAIQEMINKVYFCQGRHHYEENDTRVSFNGSFTEVSDAANRLHKCKEMHKHFDLFKCSEITTHSLIRAQFCYFKTLVQVDDSAGVCGINSSFATMFLQLLTQEDYEKALAEQVWIPQISSFPTKTLSTLPDVPIGIKEFKFEEITTLPEMTLAKLPGFKTAQSTASLLTSPQSPNKAEWVTSIFTAPFNSKEDLDSVGVEKTQKTNRSGRADEVPTFQDASTLTDQGNIIAPKAAFKDYFGVRGQGRYDIKTQINNISWWPQRFLSVPNMRRLLPLMSQFNCYITKAPLPHLARQDQWDWQLNESFLWLDAYNDRVSGLLIYLEELYEGYGQHLDLFLQLQLLHQPHFYSPIRVKAVSVRVGSMLLEFDTTKLTPLRVFTKCCEKLKIISNLEGTKMRTEAQMKRSFSTDLYGILKAISMTGHELQFIEATELFIDLKSMHLTYFPVRQRYGTGHFMEFNNHESSRILPYASLKGNFRDLPWPQRQKALLIGFLCFLTVPHSYQHNYFNLWAASSNGHLLQCSLLTACLGDSFMDVFDKIDSFLKLNKECDIQDAYEDLSKALFGSHSRFRSTQEAVIQVLKSPPQRFDSLEYLFQQDRIAQQAKVKQDEANQQQDLEMEMVDEGAGSPLKNKAGKVDASPLEKEAVKVDASPLEKEAGKVDDSPLQKEASKEDASPLQKEADKEDASPLQKKAVTVDVPTPLQKKASKVDVPNPLKKKASKVDASPLQKEDAKVEVTPPVQKKSIKVDVPNPLKKKASKADASPLQKEADKEDASPLQKKSTKVDVHTPHPKKAVKEDVTTLLQKKSTKEDVTTPLQKKPTKVDVPTPLLKKAGKVEASALQKKAVTVDVPTPFPKKAIFKKSERQEALNEAIAMKEQSLVKWRAKITEWRIDDQSTSVYPHISGGGNKLCCKFTGEHTVYDLEAAKTPLAICYIYREKHWVLPLQVFGQVLADPLILPIGLGRGRPKHGVQVEGLIYQDPDQFKSDSKSGTVDSALSPESSLSEPDEDLNANLAGQKSDADLAGQKSKTKTPVPPKKKPNADLEGQKSNADLAGQKSKTKTPVPPKKKTNPRKSKEKQSVSSQTRSRVRDKSKSPTRVGKQSKSKAIAKAEKKKTLSIQQETFHEQLKKSKYHKTK